MGGWAGGDSAPHWWGVGTLPNMMAIESIHGGSLGGVGLKMLLKNSCEGVHLLVKLLAISLQACKFIKDELLHTYFSSILATFLVNIYCFKIPGALIFQSTS